MLADKKKVIVVASLGLVIVCVGAFQFLGGSSEPEPAPAPKKVEVKKIEEAPKQDPPKNPLFVAARPARDPFAARGVSMPTPPVPQPAIQQPKVTPMPTPNFDKSGTFGNGGNAPVTITAVPEAKFSFTVSGVMLGARPVAVFTDAQGEQRLVPAGGSLDADTRVISIDKDAVTVKYHGKTMRLTVEGNPNDK